MGHLGLLMPLTLPGRPSRHRPVGNQTRWTSCRSPPRCDGRRPTCSSIHRASWMLRPVPIEERPGRGTSGAPGAVPGAVVSRDPRFPGLNSGERWRVPSRGEVNGAPSKAPVKPPRQRRRSCANPWDPPNRSSSPRPHPQADRTNRKAHAHPNTAATRTCTASPEKRPANTCNPHVKDENPATGWIRRRITVNRASHAARPASPTLSGARVPCLGIANTDQRRLWRPFHHRLPVPCTGSQPASPRSRCTVRQGGLDEPRRLPPPRDRPPILGSGGHCRRPQPSAPFVGVGLSASTRLPSPTSAATLVASLSQALRDDFCNQHGTRAHQTISATSHAPRCLAIRCGGAGFGSTAMSRAGRGQSHGRRLSRRPTHGLRKPRVSLRSRAQRPTLGSSSIPIVTRHAATRLE